MSDEIKDDLPDENGKEETPEEKASKVDKQYGQEMAFIAKVLGTDPKDPIVVGKTIDGDAVAPLVARLFKEREEKLQEEVFKGLESLVDLHLKNEASIKEDENKLKAKRTNLRKEFIKVAKAWKSKINQQSVQKSEYADILKKAIEDSKSDGTQTDVQSN
jgi:hypothetical protein